MALQVEGNHLCKVFYSENGKAFTRRVGSIVVQRADGRIERVDGINLPDSIAIYVGNQSEGKSVLEILDRPTQALSEPIPSADPLFVVRTRMPFLSTREGFCFIAGMLAATIGALLVFSAWFEVHDMRIRATSPTVYRDYSPSRF